MVIMVSSGTIVGLVKLQLLSSSRRRFVLFLQYDRNIGRFSYKTPRLQNIQTASPLMSQNRVEVPRHTHYHRSSFKLL
jgi:hypothetical protein